MAFLNASLLLGLAAIAVPLAVHLLGRREPKRVEFPAVRFLARRLETNRRRIQVRRWLLLALRMATLALIAFALAQPHVRGEAMGMWLTIGAIFSVGLLVLGGGAWALASGRPRRLVAGLLGAGAAAVLAGGGWGAVAAFSGPPPVTDAAGPAAVAIIVDNSVRMTYRSGPQQRLERAKEHARWLVDRYPEGSRVAILDRSRRPATFAIDASAAQGAIDRIEPVHLEQPLDEALLAAIQLVRQSELEDRAVYVLTDLTAAGWQEATAGELAARLSEPPEVLLQVIDVGGPSGGNWALGSLGLPSLPLSAGAAGQIAVDVLAPGDGEAEAQVELALYESNPALPVLEGQRLRLPRLEVVDRVTARADVAGAWSARLDLPSLDVGTHQGVVRLVAGDPLKADDAAYFTLQVAPPPRVLVIADDPQERAVMSRVLAPEGAAAGAEYAVTAIGSAEIGTVDVTAQDALVLLDPASIPEAFATYVATGGRLFVALGPRWPEEPPGEQEETALVPGVLRQWRVPEPGTFLDVLRPDHPALAPMAEIAGGVPWNLHPVRRYWQVEDAEASALIQMAGTGHAALLERSVGAGRVMVLTTPLPGLAGAAASWNDLMSAGDAWPAWLLARQAIGDLARGETGSLNVVVGTPVRLPQEGGMPTDYQLFAPASPPVAVQASRGSLVPGPPTTAGNYWLRGARTARGYAANLPSGATDLGRLSPESLREWLGDGQYHLVRDLKDVQLTAGEGGRGQPFYAQAMLLVCAVWLFEYVLAARFYASGAS